MRMEKKLQPATCHTHLCSSVCERDRVIMGKHAAGTDYTVIYIQCQLCSGAVGNVCVCEYLLAHSHYVMAKYST